MAQDKKVNNDKQSFWIVAIRKVNIFFRRINRQEVLTFLSFLLISTFFWVIKSASEETDVTYLMTLNIQNIPSDIVFTSQVPKQVKLSIKDKNINLLNYSYQSDLDTLDVDFNSYHDALGNFRVSGAELQALLLNKLYPSTLITAITPSLIEAKYAVTEGKSVPVVFVSDITTADNYRCHQPILSVDSVLVHAPSNILDTITMAMTERYIAEQLKDSVTITVPLDLAVGVKATPATINILIPVAKFVEKTLHGVKVNVIDVPNDESMSIFPNKVDISCLVDASFYSDVNEEDFYLTVSYNNIKSNDQKTVPIDCISYANGGLVTNIRLNTKEVEYIIDEQ